MTESGNYPDIYADGFSVTVNPVAATLTLTRTQPTGEPGHHQEPTEIVGRIRLSTPLAKAVAEALSQVVAQAAAATAQQAGAVKH